MRKIVVAFVLGMTAFAPGCTTTGMYRIVHRPIVGQAADGNFAPVVEAALTRRGWRIEARREGAIDASFAADAEHRADITISYTATSYDIQYRGSEGLDYSRGSIRRRYNNWINNLDYDLQRAMGDTR